MVKKSGHQFRCEKKRKLELQDEVIRKSVKLDKFFQKDVSVNEDKLINANEESETTNGGTCTFFSFAF